MNTTIQQLLDGAMRLPQGQRAEFAARLIDTLDPKTDDDAHAAWEDEIKRRMAEIDSGAVKTIPWSEAQTNHRGNR